MRHAASSCVALTLLLACNLSHDGRGDVCIVACPVDAPRWDAAAPDAPDARDARDAPAVIDTGPSSLGTELVAAGSGQIHAVHRVEGSRDLLLLAGDRVYRIFVADPGRPPAELVAPGWITASTTSGDRLFLADATSITRWTLDLEPAPEWHERTVEAPCITLIAGEGILHCRAERHRYVTYDLATGSVLRRWSFDRLEAADCGTLEPAIALPLAGRGAALVASTNPARALACVVSLEVPGTVFGIGSSLPWNAVGPHGLLGDPVRTLVTGDGTVLDLAPCFEGGSSCAPVTGALPGVTHDAPLVALDPTRNDALFAVHGARGTVPCEGGCEAWRLDVDGWGMAASASFTLPGAGLWPHAFADGPEDLLVVARYDFVGSTWNRWEVHRVRLVAR